jgi:O-antigen/teichoic acid export membrane protein
MTSRVLSGRALAWGPPILAEAAALGRSVAFAWAIGPEELGRAMLLALAVRLVEMAGDVGIERLVVQAPDGATARLQAELHGAALLRGAALALVLLAVAPVLAALFPDGPAASAYAVLALVPLVRGAVHLDARRHERGFRYARTAIVETGATLAMLAAIGPALAIFGDHRAMAAVLVAAALAQTVLSHVVATRRYRVRRSLRTLARVRRFGTPLVANAALLFLTFYADRLIVAAHFDLAALAVYGVALQFALLPAQIVGRAAATLLLPRFRQALCAGGVESAARTAVASHAAMGALFAAAFTLLAPPVIAAVYGAAFRPDATLAAVLGAAAAFRIVRTPLSQLAVAVGRTGDPARANLLRAAALGPALLAAAAGLPLSAVAAAAALGEAAATARALVLAWPCLSSPTPNEVSA